MKIVDVRHQLAQHPTKEYSKRPLEAIKYIVIHHSATTEGNAFSFARYHVNSRDWPGIGYHYVILGDGTIQRTNELTTVSYHVKDYNSVALGICLVGDFTKDTPEVSQKKALKELCQDIFSQLNLGIENVKGHNELTSPGYTQCPALDMDALRTYLGETDVKIFIDSAELKAPTILKNGTTFVSIRPLAEKLGYEVTWDSENYQVYLEKKDNGELERLKKERDYYYLLIQKIKKILSGE